MTGKYTPEVKDCSVFKEIALNTVNPLEILREAISNADDANANQINISIDRDEKGQFIIMIEDNGDGMGVEEIHKFFNLGFSHKKSCKIGEKGFGTKTFYKSDKIAGILLMPYIIWISYATILNYYIWILNEA